MALACFTHSHDAVQVVLSVLKRLEAGDLSTLTNRIRCQKIQYLAQVFKVSPTYSFNLYLRGPYSPDLTKDLFAAQEISIKGNSERFAADVLEERFQKLKSFIRPKDLRELELIATLHWLLNDAKYPREKAIEKLKELKNAEEDEIKKAELALKEIPNDT